MRLRAVLLAGLWLAGAASGAAADPAQRVVSMNLCTDQLAMLLAAPGQLISVSYLARDARSSAMAEVAQNFDINHGLAEEIAFLRPDLVLAGRYTTRVTVDMLQRLGYRVEVFQPENTLDDIRTNLLQMGRALGREAEAERMAEEMQQTLLSLREAADDKPGPETAVYYSSGYTAGARSLGHDIVTTAGLQNIAPKLGLGASGILPLEALILSDADMVIRGASYQGYSRSEEMLRHPALERMLAAPRLTAETRPEWTCGTPLTLSAIHDLRAAAGLEPLE
ncbi:ABC transporter substrate-binding protein [Falsigemmobacter faecalis]|nr:ABC transporter substrate-binding protein [Falsigemmobacter faecalis]